MDGCPTCESSFLPEIRRGDESRRCPLSSFSVAAIDATKSRRRSQWLLLLLVMMMTLRRMPTASEVSQAYELANADACGQLTMRFTSCCIRTTDGHIHTNIHTRQQTAHAHTGLLWRGREGGRKRGREGESKDGVSNECGLPLRNDVKPWFRHKTSVVSHIVHEIGIYSNDRLVTDLGMRVLDGDGTLHRSVSSV